MSRSVITERLSIQLLTLSDSQFILDLIHTEGWEKFIGDLKIHSEADAISYIKEIIASPDTHYWVVRLRSNDACIGVITFMKRDYLQFPDIAFAFLPGYSNSGYAYESTAALIIHAIDQAPYTHICAITKANNPQSIKLLNKLGLKYLKEIEVDNEKLLLYEASIDMIAITHITNSFFSIFTNKANKQPNFDLLREICIPEVLITNKHGSDADVFDLALFIDRSEQILINGTLTEFDGQETFAETRILKNIASRFSEYKKTGIVFRQRFQVTGSKFFQFVKINHSWKICSILWSDSEKVRHEGSAD